MLPWLLRKLESVAVPVSPFLAVLAVGVVILFVMLVCQIHLILNFPAQVAPPIGSVWGKTGERQSAVEQHENHKVMENQKAFELEFKALGTEIYFQLLADEGNDANAEKDLAELKEFYFFQEKIFSRFSIESELNFFNHNLGEFHKASADLLQVAEKVLLYYTLSDGLFDPRIIETLEKIGYAKDFKTLDLSEIKAENFENESFGELEKDLIIENNQLKFLRRMDFSGIAKGYITDKAGDILREKNWQNFLIDSGGDMFAFGQDLKKENWKINLEGFAEDKILLELENEAVATSGIGKRKWESGGKRFHHLINPKNPADFSFDLQSVTAIAKTVVEADVWAKVLFLAGKSRGQKIAQEKKLKSIFLDYRGNAWMSAEMKNKLNVKA